MKAPPTPVNVRFQRSDGAIIPVELRYVGRRWHGLRRYHLWQGICRYRVGHDFELCCDEFPARTIIDLHLVVVEHPA